MIQGKTFCYLCPHRHGNERRLLYHYVTKHWHEESILRDFGLNINALILHREKKLIIYSFRRDREKIMAVSAKASSSNKPSFIGKRTVSEHSSSISRLEPVLTRSKTNQSERKDRH